FRSAAVERSGYVSRLMLFATTFRICATFHAPAADLPRWHTQSAGLALQSSSAPGDSRCKLPASPESRRLLVSAPHVLSQAASYLRPRRTSQSVQKTASRARSPFLAKAPFARPA